MSAYRDETEALRAQNASLTAELAAAHTEIARLRGQYDVVPVATSTGSGVGCAIAGAAALFVAIAGGTAFFVLRARASKTETTQSRLPTTVRAGAASPMTDGPAPPPWEGAHGAILLDLNGDGTPDIIGRVRYMPGDDSVHAAAFDGATGRELWESPSLGDYVGTLTGTLAATPTSLFFASDGGWITAFDMTNGAKRWRVSVPERVKSLCAADDLVGVRLADGSYASFRTSDGAAMSRVLSGTNCGDLPTDSAARASDTEPKRDAHLDGMNATMREAIPSGPIAVLGTRSPGTPVPMVAALYEDASKNWKSNVAAIDPLLSRETIPEAGLAATKQGIFTLYSPTSDTQELHLVGFDLVGHRLFDTVFSGRSPFESLQANEHGIFVSQWGRLGVYEPSSGRLLFEIGKGQFP